MAASLLVGLLASLALAAWAVRAERIATTESDAKQLALQAETRAKQDAETRRQEAEAARQQAQTRLTQIEKGNDIITSIFTDLDIRKIKQGTEPLEAVLAERLVKAAGQLEGEAVGDPLVVAQLQNRLGLSLVRLGHAPAAIELLVKARATRAAQLGADHPDTLTSMNNLALGYQAAGKLDLALPLYEETLKLRRARLGAEHPDTLTSMNNLGKAYCGARQGEKAAPLLKEFIAGQRKRFPKEDPPFAGLLAQVSLDLLKCQQFPAAEEMLRECLAIREKKEPEAWTTFNTCSMLGGALLGRAGSVSDGSEKAKLLADAEPLLLKGYEGMKAREKDPAADAARLALQQCLAEALDRLIDLYTALDKPDEVKKWQAELAKYPDAKEEKE